jgi:uncharacterized protein YcbK (DUF882 family)/LysM repeat protein
MLPDFLRSRGARGGSTSTSTSTTAAGPRSLAALALAAFLTVAPSAAGAADGQHTVSRGQTLYAIARRYRTTVDALREANGLKPWQRLKPGLVLTIPERDKDGGGAEPSRSAALRRQPERHGAAGATPAAPPPAPRAGKAAGANGKKHSGAADKDDEPGKGKGKNFAQKSKRPGWVRVVRGAERAEFQLLTRQGRVVPKSLPQLSRLMRASPTASLPVDPRLATLIGMVSNHFGGRTIRIVSGFRPYSTRQYTPHSNHNFGRAMDFVVEGVPNTAVRDFCRTFRSAGVGYYPNSTFVHLDVRSAKVYWVDYSRPGEAPRYDASRGAVAADEAASDVPGAAEEEVYGSEKTHPPDAQPVDITNGTQKSEGSDPMKDKNPGLNSPSPSVVPSPASR